MIGNNERANVILPDVIEDQESAPLGKPLLGLCDLFVRRKFFDAEAEPFGELSANLFSRALTAALKNYHIESTLSAPGKLEC